MNLTVNAHEVSDGVNFYDLIKAIHGNLERLLVEGARFVDKGMPQRASAPYPCFVTDPFFNIRVSVHMNRRLISCRNAPSPMSRFLSLMACTAISSAVIDWPLASRNAVWHRLVSSPTMKCADRWNRVTSRLARRRFGLNSKMVASICMTWERAADIPLHLRDVALDFRPLG